MAPDPRPHDGPPLTDDQAMALALAEAARAPGHGDVPVGALALVDGVVVASAHNERELRGDPTAHAEILALAGAARALGTWRLGEVTLVVTLEPCLMCAGALVNARVGRLVFGAEDLAAGACGSLYNLCDDPRLNHRLPVVTGVRRSESAALLRSFFADRRTPPGGSPDRPPEPRRSPAPEDPRDPLLASPAERCPSGRRCNSRKVVWCKPPWVQIPPAPLTGSTPEPPPPSGRRRRAGDAPARRIPAIEGSVDVAGAVAGDGTVRIPVRFLGADRHPRQRVTGDVQEARMEISRRAFLGGGLGALGAGLLAACSDSTSSGTTPGSDLGAVEHVVFLMQENRSFDHYFGTYPGVRGFDDRSDDALSRFHQPWPNGANGATTLLPFNLASATAQICSGNASIPIHDWAPQHQSWDGGTNEQFVTVHTAEDGAAQGPMVMGYFTRQQLGYYYALADAFTICDNYHCSVLGPTMPNRLYKFSAFLDPEGTHGGPVLETPGLTTAKDAVGSVSWDTMPEVLTDKGVSWKVYQPPGSSAGPAQDSALALGFNALLYFKQFVSKPNSTLYKNAFVPSWPNDFESDVKKGTLPSVSWIMPPIAYSEHPNGSPAAGEWFTAQVLDTLTSNPKLWAKTVVFLTYDENGGFFDHVVPPTPPAGTPGEEVTASAATAEGGGVAGPIGLGFRVPMTVVSPWSRGGYVDSATYDHTSLLRFLEARFDVKVPNLTAWRRQAVGDLTSTLGFAKPNDARPKLPATSLDLGTGCPTSTNLIPFLTPPEPLNLPTEQQLPTQEPGTARRR